MAVDWTGRYAVTTDYDSDRKTDPAIYETATENGYVKFSASGYATVTLEGFGGSGTRVAAADYDGDGLADPIYLDEATGIWHVKLSSSGYAEATLASGYMP